MYKTGILNSEISKVLSDLGHTDRIVIAEFTVPKGVRKIDLALTFGVPSFESVYDILLEHMSVQKMILQKKLRLIIHHFMKRLKKQMLKENLYHTKHLKINTRYCRYYKNRGSNTICKRHIRK